MRFKTEVLNIVNQIPFSQVLTYGAVAAIAGSPRAARQVGQILKGLGLLEKNIPWWRVVNKNLEISIKGDDINAKEVQKSLLLKEGWQIQDYKLIKIRS